MSICRIKGRAATAIGALALMFGIPGLTGFVADWLPSPLSAVLASSVHAASPGKGTGGLPAPLQVHIRPAAGEMVRMIHEPLAPIEVSPGDTIDVRGTDLNLAKLRRKGDSLVITTAEGRKLRFSKFYARLPAGTRPPTLLVDDETPVASGTQVKIVSRDGEVRFHDMSSGEPIEVTPGEMVYLVGKRADEAVLTRDGRNLRITTAFGEEAMVKDFFASLGPGEVPPMWMFGDEPVPALVLLAMLEPNTAAGRSPEPVHRSERAGRPH